MNLQNAGDVLATLEAVQKKLDSARASLTITEQENLRLKGLIQDQESIIRGNIEKTQNTSAELAELDLKKRSLEDETTVFVSRRNEAADELASFARTLEEMRSEHATLLKEAEEKREEIKTLIIDAERIKTEANDAAHQTTLKINEREADLASREMDVKVKLEKIRAFQASL